MKKTAAFLVLFFCLASAVSAQKARPGQTVKTSDPAEFAIPVHVSAARIVPECPTSGLGGCESALVLEATIAGTKYELQGGLLGGKSALLTQGNYKAKVASEFHSPSGVFGREYQLLLLDNSTWQGVVSGVSE